MPISKIYLFIFSFIIANSQQIESKLYNDLYSKGQWGSYYILNSDGSYKHFIEAVPIDSVHLISDDVLNNRVLDRLFGSIKGLSSANQVHRQLNSIEDAYPFLHESSTLSFAKYENTKVAAVIEFDPIFKEFKGLDHHIIGEA